VFTRLSLDDPCEAGGFNMTYAFTIEDEIDVDVSPDEVWLAITVGPRIDSWFMGRNDIEPRAGGAVRTDLGDFVMASTVTAWEPPSRFAYRTSEDASGACMQFEWRIEPRVGGGATVHFTHRGRLADEGGQAEYEALTRGDPMYVRKLARYLEFFNGQTAVCNIAAAGPPVADTDRFWATLKRTLGLRASVSEWDPVHASLDGLGTIAGIVDYVTPEFLGVRTRTSMLRFIYGFGGTVLVEHHEFGSARNGHISTDAWQAWLHREFA